MEDKQRGIVPRKIKGFRDITPELNQLRWKIIQNATKIYKKYGFEHWDTPALEYADCLGKYMPDKETVEEGVYSFNNPETEPVLSTVGKELRDENQEVVMENHPLALRYDLTAPLARHYAEGLFMNQVRGNLVEGKTPLFRRYQFGPVFRYEAKLDPGRFREFWQVDFDTVGSNDVAADAEICMVLSESLQEIGLQPDTFIIKVNNRKILQGFLAGMNIHNAQDVDNILRIVDKKDKIELDAVANELGKGRKDKSGAIIPGLGLDADLVNKIIDFLASFAQSHSRKSVLDKLTQQLENNKLAIEGVNELRKMDNILAKLQFDESKVIFDPTLVRGMAYYTGPIFEVESTLSYTDSKGRKRKVGSICGGGRYDGLVKNLLGIKVPATGASIGVDRLAELLTFSNNEQKKEPGPVLIVVFDDELMPEYQKIAAELRAEDIAAEVYYGAKRGLRKQLQYADKKNAPVALLLGEDELKKGVVTVRDLKLGERLSEEITDKKQWKKRAQMEVSRDNLLTKVKELII